MDAIKCLWVDGFLLKVVFLTMVYRSKILSPSLWVLVAFFSLGINPHNLRPLYSDSTFHQSLLKLKSPLTHLKLHWGAQSLKKPYLPPKPSLGRSNFEGDPAGKKFRIENQVQKQHLAYFQLGRAQREFSRVSKQLRGKFQNLEFNLRKKGDPELFREIISPLCEEISHLFRSLSLMSENSTAKSLNTLKIIFSDLSQTFKNDFSKKPLNHLGIIKLGDFSNQMIRVLTQTTRLGNSNPF